MREIELKIELLAKNRNPIKEQELLERLGNTHYSFDIKNQFFIVAIKNRYLEIAKFLIDQGLNISHYGYETKEVMRFSIKNGHFEEVKFLANNGAEISYDDLEIAVKHMRWNICQFLAEKGFFSLSGISGMELEIPIKTGHVDVIKMLVEYGADITSMSLGDLVSNAIESGDLEFVKFLIKNNSQNNFYYFGSRGDFADIELLIRERNLEEIKTRLMIFDDFRQRAGEILILAAENSFLELASFLVDEAMITHGSNAKGALQIVVRNGDLGFVRYLIENGIGIEHDVGELLEIAEHNGHFSVAEYLRSQKIGTSDMLDNDFLHSDHMSEIRHMMGEKDLEGIYNKMTSSNFSEPQKVKILEVAVREGNLDIARYLLERVNVKDFRGVKLLQIAAEHEDLQMAALLIENGINARACIGDYSGNFGISRIKNLISNRKLEEVKTIMAVSIFSTREKIDLLLSSITEGNLVLSRYFLESITDLSGANGIRCLKMALDKKNWEIVNLLIEKGANYKACRKEYVHKWEVEELARDGKVEDIKTILQVSRFSQQDKQEMFFHFVRDNNLELAESLLNVGVKISGEREVEFFLNAVSVGNLEWVTNLLSHGIDPKANNSEALMRAVTGGHLNIAKILIERGADRSVINPDLVLSAASNGNLNMLKFLIKNHVGDNYHLEQAFKAAHNCHKTEVVKFFLKHALKPSIIGDHVLKDYVERNDSDMVSLLIKYGADIRGIDELFKSAVLKKNEKMVECFLKIGVNIAGVKMEGFSKNFHNLVDEIDQYYHDQFYPSMYFNDFFQELREQLHAITEIFTPYASLALQRIIGLKDPVFARVVCIDAKESELLFPEHTLSFINFAAEHSYDITKFVIENPKVIKNLKHVQKSHLFAQQRNSELPALPMDVIQKILSYTLDEELDLAGQMKYEDGGHD
jgi:ankyrin repeat protein